MNANLWRRIGRLAYGLAASAALGALALPAWSQATPKTAPLPKPSPVAAPADDPFKAPQTAPAKARAETQDAVRDARKGTRDAAQDAREGARNTAEGAREGAQDARRDAREAVRDARQDFREARRDARQNLRAADLGLWFNPRVGAAGAAGLTIADIAAQGGISKVGFMEGDRIVSVNGTPVTTEAEFTRLLTDDSLRNQQVKVAVMRGDREQIVTVQPSVLMQEVAAYDPLWQYGLILDDRYKDRIVIQRVFPRTPAYYAGLRAGDTVIGLRGQRLAAVADLVNALTQADGNLSLQINRGNRTRDVQLDASGALGRDVETTLRPNIDDPNRRATTPGDRTPADRTPRIDSPATPATPATPAIPPRPGAPATPATPAIPGAGAPATPATPALPPRPTTPAAPKVPAPKVPATPPPPAP
jgi:hypothetical protein